MLTTKSSPLVCGLSTVVQNIAHAIGGWNGESIKLSLNSVVYSVKQLEDERTICGIVIKDLGVNSFNFSFNVIFDRSFLEESSS